MTDTTTAPTIHWDEPDNIGTYVGIPVGTFGHYRIVTVCDRTGNVEFCEVWQGDDYREVFMKLGDIKTVEGAKAFAERRAQEAAR